jgi:hypothetical protein
MKMNDFPELFLAIFCIVITATSCGPKIFYFKSDQYSVTANDSVRLTWSVRGVPTLLVYTDTADAGELKPEYRHYDLVVRKNAKEIMKSVLITVLQVKSMDDIVFSTIRKGDSVIASGIKDTVRWGTYFKLETIASASGRPLTVTHGGKTVLIDKNGNPSAAFCGIANSGPWVISSHLTDSEKKDTTTIPARLKIHTVIVHQKLQP